MNETSDTRQPEQEIQAEETVDENCSSDTEQSAGLLIEIDPVEVASYQPRPAGVKGTPSNGGPREDRRFLWQASAWRT